MNGTVVVDTSVLIALDLLDRLDLLTKLFDDVVAPTAVLSEFQRGDGGRWKVVYPQARTRPGWRDARLFDPTHARTFALWECPMVATSSLLLLKQTFGAGEAEVLALASDIPGVTVLLDDYQARQYARRRGLRVKGAVGLLLHAKDAGLVLQVRPLLDALRAGSFRISNVLYAEALRIAKEA
jgi:predicted nucleic acid-binding protein